MHYLKGLGGNKMALTQMKAATPTIGEELAHILADMDSCVHAQEDIIIEERAAMKIFDGFQLAILVERRARCQSELTELESRCQRLIIRGEVGEKLADLIDRYAGHDVDDLQSQRVELARRMQQLEQQHVENHIRLRAAWNVTTSILQQVGVVEAQTTYSKVNYAATQQQGIR